MQLPLGARLGPTKAASCSAGAAPGCTGATPGLIRASLGSAGAAPGSTVNIIISTTMSLDMIDALFQFGTHPCPRRSSTSPDNPSPTEQTPFQKIALFSLCISANYPRLANSAPPFFSLTWIAPSLHFFDQFCSSQVVPICKGVSRCAPRSSPLLSYSSF